MILPFGTNVWFGTSYILKMAKISGIYHGDGKKSAMCDVTRVNAVINHGAGQFVMCIYHGDGKESAMCKGECSHKSWRWSMCDVHISWRSNVWCDKGACSHISKSSDDIDHLTIPGHRLSIGDQWVMWQGCMQSFIIKMAKSSDDIDHLTISCHCLSIGDQCVMWQWCCACSHISWRWQRTMMPLTIWPFQKRWQLQMESTMTMHFGKNNLRGTPLLEYLGPMCDVTRVHAVIYHGDGKESPMCDVTRVHTVIYHGDSEEQWW